VKQKDKAGRPDIDAFEAMMARADRQKGFFVSFDFARCADRDRRLLPQERSNHLLLTVKEILNEEIARTLA